MKYLLILLLIIFGCQNKTKEVGKTIYFPEGIYHSDSSGIWQIKGKDTVYFFKGNSSPSGVHIKGDGKGKTIIKVMPNAKRNWLIERTPATMQQPLNTIIVNGRTYSKTDSVIKGRFIRDTTMDFSGSGLIK